MVLQGYLGDTKRRPQHKRPSDDSGGGTGWGVKLAFVIISATIPINPQSFRCTTTSGKAWGSAPDGEATGRHHTTIGDDLAGHDVTDKKGAWNDSTKRFAKEGQQRPSAVGGSSWSLGFTGQPASLKVMLPGS